MHLTEYEFLTLLVSLIALLLIPTIGLLLRLVVKWTRTEYRIESLAEDMKELMRQAGDDRKATDHRLRWLEENLWMNRGSGKHAIRD
jgi:hypothetical protein